MAGSSSQGKMFFEEWVTHFMAIGQISRIMDVGPGAGVYGHLVRKVIPEVKKYNKLNEFVLHACEPFEPYHAEYQLNSIYDEVFPVLIQDWLKTIKDYDLIIFGDVLEHLERDVAIDVFRQSKKKAKFVWISIPILALRNWSQPFDSRQNNAHPGAKRNILEKHLYDWSYEEVLKSLGPFLWQVPFSTVAICIAEGAYEKIPEKLN